jgi:uncharacterized surface protein with fasciclin (FAS1) repeats
MRRTFTTLAAAAALVAATAVPALAKGPKAPSDVSVWDIVQNSPVHGTLEFAIGAAGLDGVLDADGVQFTLFAPTDAAFEKVAGELGFANPLELATFLAGAGLLDDVLLYHVTEGRRWSNSVVPNNGTKEIPTLLGSYLVATTAGMLMDASAATSNANIGPANLSASNGVVHVIDNVLVPLP